MSEKFAYYKESNIGIHFVIETEETGQWHTYLIAINEEEYEKYKEIIDYTYARSEKVPQPIKVYGYPVITTDEIKNLAIKNIQNFVPAENEIKITPENYENYLTNSYLDTTKERKEEFSVTLLICLFLLVAAIILFIMTLFNRDKVVDNIDKKIEKQTKKITKKYKNRKNK